MTKEDNIAYAKKHLIPNIYSTTKLEHINITFPQTETLLNGINVSGISLSDIEKVINLRDAWKYLFEQKDKPFDLDFICKINSFVARNESIEWGVLRYENIGISGVTYKPKIPIEEEVLEKLAEIKNVKNPVDQAIKYFLYATREQLFYDGNKRTSWICANKILIDNGAGLFIIPEGEFLKFNELLNDYYNQNITKEITNFLKTNAIHQMVRQKKH